MIGVSEIREQLQEYNHFDIEIQPETTFDQLQMSSYDIVDFIMMIESKYNIVIQNEKIISLETIQDMMNTINSIMEDK